MYASRKSNKKMYLKLKKIISKYIEKDWSQEQISDRLKTVNFANISHVRIYQFIEQNK